VGFLDQGLRAVELKSLVTVTVGVVVDVVSATESAFEPYCDKIMSALLECLRSGVINREVKPVVITAVGDIAMALGASFVPYLQVTLSLLIQASSQQPIPDDEEFTAFINSLRLSVLEAYSGILYGLAESNKMDLLIPSIPAMVSLLQHLATDPTKDEDVLRQAVTLVGDMAKTLVSDPQTKLQLNQPFVAQLIHEAMAQPDTQFQEAAKFAQEHMQRLVSSA
jgi:importin subunit beta-1